MRWQAFLSWNNRTDGFFGPDDIIGFGDADEIPSAHNIYLLKHCKMAGPSVDIGSWFAWSRLDRAFRPDWPVPNHPWTLGDPTYWTLRSAAAYSDAGEGNFPNRMRGTSGHYLLGGVHMTDSPYLPFMLAKTIACTECDESSLHLFKELRGCFGGETCPDNGNEEVFMATLMSILDRAATFKDRLMDVEAAKNHLGEAYFVPWFIECFPDRFPAWFGKTDKRVVVAG